VEHIDPPVFLKICSETLEGTYGPAIQTAGIIFIVLLFNFVINTLLFKLRTRFSEQKKIWALSFVSAIHKPLRYYVWFIAGICSLDILSSSLFKFHVLNVHLVLSIGAVLMFGWFLLRWNAKVVHFMMEMSQNHTIALTPGKLDLISKIATISVIFITLFLLMDVTGRNMQTLIAFGGVGGLALAFASQQVISNFFGGLMVYITQPFMIGEWVNLPERKIEGHIEEIGWYMTRIRNFEKRPIYVPNSIFTQTIVITPSRMSHERFHQAFHLRYQNLDQITTFINAIRLMLAKHEYVDQGQAVEVFIINLGPSSFDVDVSAYMAIGCGMKFNPVKQDILLQIAKIVSEQDIQLAAPAQTIEIMNADLLKLAPTNLELANS
jgi:MscS family membrane protein